MDRRSTPLTVAGIALQATQPPIAKSDHRHGARNFGDEPAVPSRRLLLRHIECHARQVKTTCPHGDISMLLSSSTIFDTQSVF